MKALDPFTMYFPIINLRILTNNVKFGTGADLRLGGHLAFVDTGIACLNIFNLQYPFFGGVLEVGLESFVGYECDPESTNNNNRF